MANWVEVWQSLSRRELFRKTGVATGVMLVLGSLLEKASAQIPGAPMQQIAPPMQIPQGGGLTTDYFLKIDGIDGESNDHKHKGEIDILSYAWGETNGGSRPGGGGGGGAGKVQMEDMKFVMRVNKASPKLMLACASGIHSKGAILTCRKAGRDQGEYLKWTLTDVLVSTYQTGVREGNNPTDHFAVEFARIDMEYREQKPDGTLGGAVKAGWDVKLNKPVF